MSMLVEEELDEFGFYGVPVEPEEYQIIRW